jgi:hypothetical protein
MSNKIGIGIDVISGPGIDADATTIYNRIIADGGVSDLTRLNFFVKGLKAIYGSLTNVPVCYDAHWIGYKLGSGTGATAGQAAAKLYSLTVAGDAVQTTAASQPLLLAHNGSSSGNYYQGVGVLTNSVTTPNASANNITGDIEIIWNITSLNISTISQIVGKFGSSFCYNVYQWSSQRLYFETQYGAVISSNHGVTSGTNIWFKITRTSSNGNISFFKSTDGITYSLINTDTTKSAGALSTGGTLDIFNADPQVAKLFRLTISNSIGGAPVVDFNPATYNASTSQTAWTSATGEVWTINTGTATTGYKGVLVDRTITMLDGVDDTIRNTSVLRGDICSQYLAYKTENAVSSGYAFLTSTSGLYDNAFTPESANMKLYMNGSLGSLTKTLGTTLALFTATNNQGVLNTLQRNNDTEVSNTYTPALSGTGISIGRTGIASTFQKGNINTYILITGTDNTTVRTATYNLIRSLNNNAF